MVAQREQKSRENWTIRIQTSGLHLFTRREARHRTVTVCGIDTRLAYGYAHLTFVKKDIDKCEVSGRLQTRLAGHRTRGRSIPT